MYAGYVEKNVEATLRTYVQHCNNARFIFAGTHFKCAGKEIEENAIIAIYQQFEGITWYIQKVLNTLYDMTPEQGLCRVEMVPGAIRQIIDSFRYTYSEILFRLPENKRSY